MYEKKPGWLLLCEDEVIIIISRRANKNTDRYVCKVQGRCPYFISRLDVLGCKYILQEKGYIMIKIKSNGSME